MMAAHSNTHLLHVPIIKISFHQQVRAKLDPLNVKLTAASIQQGGLLMPIRLRLLEDGTYVVLDGHYRLAAMQSLGWTEIPSIIDPTPMSPTEVTGLQLAANQVRRTLNIMDEADAYDRYLRASGSTAARLASLIGRTEAHICRTRALVGLKPELKQLVADSTLGPSLALELDRISDQATYSTLLQNARKGNLTRSDIIKARTAPRAARTVAAPTPSAPPMHRLTIPQVTRGVTVTISGRVQALPQFVDALQVLAERARVAASEAHDNLEAFLNVLRKAPAG